MKQLRTFLFTLILTCLFYNLTCLKSYAIAEENTTKIPNNMVFYIVKSSARYSDYLIPYVKELVSLYAKKQKRTAIFKVLYSPTAHDLLYYLSLSNTEGILPITSSYIRDLQEIKPQNKFYASNATLPFELFFNYPKTITHFSIKDFYQYPTCVTQKSFEHLSEILPYKPNLLHVAKSIKECIDEIHVFPIIAGSTLDLQNFSIRHHEDRTSNVSFIYNPPNASYDFYVNILFTSKEQTTAFNAFLEEQRAKKKLIPLVKKILKTHPTIK